MVGWLWFLGRYFFSMGGWSARRTRNDAGRAIKRTQEAVGAMASYWPATGLPSVCMWPASLWGRHKLTNDDL